MADAAQYFLFSVCLASPVHASSVSTLCAHSIASRRESKGTMGIDQHDRSNSHLGNRLVFRLGSHGKLANVVSLVIWDNHGRDGLFMERSADCNIPYAVMLQ